MLAIAIPSQGGPPNLPYGATFKAGGSEYRCADADYDPKGQLRTDDVILSKYSGSSRNVVLDRVKYGGIWHRLDGVGSKAFDTKAGRKVRSLTFGLHSYCGIVEAHAFKNTKSLKTLDLGNSIGVYVKGDDATGKTTATFFSSTEYDKHAFTGIGAESGLTVKFNNVAYHQLHPDNIKAIKDLLATRGLPKSAKWVPAWQE